VSLSEARALAKLVDFLIDPPWTREQVDAAVHEAPHVHLRHNREMVEADAALNIAYWRVLSMLSPLSVGSRFADFYPLVKEVLIEELHLDSDQVGEPARAIARYLHEEAESLANRPRGSLDHSTKIELFDLSHGRCWYCGYKFPEVAESRFLGSGVAAGAECASLPLFVDFVTDRGRDLRDFLIEIDHVSPLSRLGTDVLDNLRVSCGWCNRHKGARSLLFDAQALPILYDHPRLGRLFIPQPFWVVRRLGTRRRCDYPGCLVGVDTSQLCVAPIRAKGAMVPGNLGLYCDIHDPLKEHRYVPR
jgi:hypothetical protein